MAIDALKKKAWRIPELAETTERFGLWQDLRYSTREQMVGGIILEPVMAREAVEAAKMATNVGLSCLSPKAEMPVT